jgi:K+-transporting ATPase KdpF subunit
MNSIFEFFKNEFTPKKLPFKLFLLLCLNVAIAPAVQAATGATILRYQSYALGLLGLTTLSLSIYLFVVIFQPEKF